MAAAIVTWLAGQWIATVFASVHPAPPRRVRPADAALGKRQLIFGLKPTPSRDAAGQLPRDQ